MKFTVVIRAASGKEYRTSIEGDDAAHAETILLASGEDYIRYTSEDGAVVKLHSAQVESIVFYPEGAAAGSGYAGVPMDDEEPHGAPRGDW